MFAAALCVVLSSLSHDQRPNVPSSASVSDHVSYDPTTNHTRPEGVVIVGLDLPVNLTSRSGLGPVLEEAIGSGQADV